jgi:DNA-binding CsgD family transcriptional regulator
MSDRVSAALHHSSLHYLLIVEIQPRHDERALHLFGCLFKLTPAEERILSEILEDKSPSQIAETLGASLPTVRTHIQRILQKTGTKRITDLVHRVSHISLPL